MRSHLALELIGTFWVAIGVLASTEEKAAAAVLFMFIGLSYYLRAIVKYYSRKEKVNAPKAGSPGKSGVFAGSMRMRDRKYSGHSNID